MLTATGVSLFVGLLKQTKLRNVYIHTLIDISDNYINPFRKKSERVKSLSCFRLFATPWTIAYQASPFMGFSRQECWSGLPFPSPGDLPDPGIKPGSPALQADA